jgi:hypothetical protein
MQKRRRSILTILCLVVYTVSVCGITINKHFCGGELESVSFLKKGSCCETETEDEPDDCCADESIYVANNSETLHGSPQTPVAPDFVFIFEAARGELDAGLVTIDPKVINAKSKGKPPFPLLHDLSVIMVYRI